MPANLDAIRVIILFIIPGFVTTSVIAASVPRPQRNTNETLFESVTYRCLVYAVLGWPLLVWPDLYPEIVARLGWLAPALWVLVLFVAPLALGLLISWLLSRGSLLGLYGWFGLRYQHPIPRAWDFYFGQRKQGWLRITLTDGSLLGGFMGAESFASSFPAPDDVYLEAVYSVDKYGTLSAEPVPNTSGAWIQGSQIRVIEFIPLPEGATEDGGTVADEDPG